MGSNIFRAGAIQFDIINGDIKRNVDTAILHLENLADNGVSLAVLPELFSCGFDNARIARHAESTPCVLKRLSVFAAANDMAIAGSLPEKAGNSVFNTLYFIDRDGEIKGQYRKLHLFPLTDEPVYYTPGNHAVVLETSFGKTGLLICYDLRFPELARKLCLAGAQLFVVSAQWPTPRKAHWQTLVRARAIENQGFVVCSNRTGTDGELSFPGCSAVIDPFGQMLAEADSKSCSVWATVDMNEINRADSLIPVKKDRRNDIYG